MSEHVYYRSEISHNELSFNQAAQTYQAALTSSGYQHQLKFKLNNTSNNSERRHLLRKVIWFNPPFSKNVANNVGKSFLKIIKQEFPTTHILHKIFNRNTIKISYSGMPNIKQKISSRNKKLMDNNHSEPQRLQLQTAYKLSGEWQLPEGITYIPSHCSIE